MANIQLLAAWSVTTTAQEKHAHRNSQSYIDSPRSRWEAAALAGYGGGGGPADNDVPKVKLTDAQHKALEFLSQVEYAWISNRTGYGMHERLINRKVALALMELGYITRLPSTLTGRVVITLAGRAALTGDEASGVGGGYVPNTSQVEAKLTDAVRAEIETFSPAEQLVVLTQFQDMYSECEDEQTWRAFLNTWLNFGRHVYGNEVDYAATH